MYEENVVAYFNHHLSGQPPFDRWIYNFRMFGRRNNPYVFGYYKSFDKLFRGYHLEGGPPVDNHHADTYLEALEQGPPWKK